MATKTLTVKEVAEKFGTDGRTLRKFLRHEVKQAGGTIGEDTPGKGRRYSLEAKEVTAMRKRFNAWNAPKAVEAEVDEVEAEASIEVELD